MGLTFYLTQLILIEKKVLVLFLMSYDCYCSVALLQGAVGWSSVCDCGIGDHTDLSDNCLGAWSVSCIFLRSACLLSLTQCIQVSQNQLEEQ